MKSRMVNLAVEFSRSTVANYRAQDVPYPKREIPRERGLIPCNYQATER